MEWQDEGIVLSARPHGETSALVSLFTRERGRHLGLVRGGRSRRVRPVLQPGNIVNAAWRARLDEHLGSLTLELKKSHSARLFDEAEALAGLSLLCAHLGLFAERDPHPFLYDGACYLLEHMDEPDIWPGLLARFEMEVLGELGFQLDFSCCAATGGTEDLIYVSPKSGRAVSRTAGAPYKEKLLPLPAFLVQPEGALITRQDLDDAFRLNGYFLERHIYDQRGREEGAVRANFMRLFSRGRGRAGPREGG